MTRFVILALCALLASCSSAGTPGATTSAATSSAGTGAGSLTAAKIVVDLPAKDVWMDPRSLPAATDFVLVADLAKPRFTRQLP